MEQINLKDKDFTNGLIAELCNKIREVERIMDENAENNQKLLNQFTELSKVAECSVDWLRATAETVKAIQDVAMNTRILGFNASIEASRAKESGKGFGVIAQEVRGLAEVSTQSTDKIEGIIQNIGNDTDKISQGLQNTEDIICVNMENSKEMRQYLTDILQLTEKLK